MDAVAQLESFIDRYQPGVASDARHALAFIRSRLPTATQLVYDNYNALVIGFGASEKPGDLILSIALYPRYVTLFFARGAELPDPYGLLEGSGSMIRGVKLQPVSRIETEEVLPEVGEGLLTIQSISAKQRPRRPKD